MHEGISIAQVAALALAAAPLACGGPFSAALDDPANSHDAPVPGFVGPHGTGKARLIAGLDDDNQPFYQNPLNFVNPLFFAWAEEVMEYAAAEFVQTDFSNPALALGPVTGDNWDTVSLGDMSASQIANEDPPGTLTVRLGRPVRDLTGADFVVFENGIIAGTSETGATVGQIFGELAYVEVSADGENFTRFPAISLTAAAVGGYGSIDATAIHNLAGKHANAGGESWGTPFDLAAVGLSEIQYVRLVDIPGSGAFTDSGGRPIYDPWKTFGSGGFDLEAVGGISTLMNYADWPLLDKLPADKRGMEDDPDGDGIPNLLEYAFAGLPSMHDAPDGLPRLRIVREIDTSFAELEFVRDERLADLTYEVQFSASLAADGWTGIARSSGGGPLTALSGHAPVIVETSASPIASIGVLRKVSVRDNISSTADPRRFYRVKVISEPLPEQEP